MKKAALVIFYLLSIAAASELSARAAMKNQMRGFAVELAQIQGMLAFNHLERYRELESNLSKGCNAAVLEKLKMSAATESVLLSSALKEHPGGWLEKHVADREPNLPAQLANYQSPYGNAWKEPKCQ
jgi:hypothetical protein